MLKQLLEAACKTASTLSDARSRHQLIEENRYLAEALNAERLRTADLHGQLAKQVVEPCTKCLELEHALRTCRPRRGLTTDRC